MSASADVRRDITYLRSVVEEQYFILLQGYGLLLYALRGLVKYHVVEIVNRFVSRVAFKGENNVFTARRRDLFAFQIINNLRPNLSRDVFTEFDGRTVGKFHFTGNSTFFVLLVIHPKADGFHQRNVR